jgi:hypothetical protein
VRSPGRHIEVSPARVREVLRRSPQVRAPEREQRLAADRQVLVNQAPRRSPQVPGTEQEQRLVAVNQAPRPWRAEESRAPSAAWTRAVQRRRRVIGGRQAARACHPHNSPPRKVAVVAVAVAVVVVVPVVAVVVVAVAVAAAEEDKEERICIHTHGKTKSGC